MTVDLPSDFGPYQLTSRLGRGAMGIVYRALDTRAGRDVALKVMLPDIADDVGTARFVREGEAASQLVHRNLVTVYEVGVVEQCPYIAMELLEGMTLAQRIALRDPATLEATLDIVIQLCEGLQHAHEHGVVHRDVKPANIWLLDNGAVKLLDFGLAKVSGSSVTRAGSVVGSVSYMSPEQLAGVEVDGRADMFAAGAILYELLTGRKAFESDSVPGVMNRILYDTPVPVRTYVPDVPSEIESALATALQKKPDQRFAEIADFGTELRLARYGLATGVASLLTDDEPDRTTIVPRASVAGSSTSSAMAAATTRLASGARPVLARGNDLAVRPTDSITSASTSSSDVRRPSDNSRRGAPRWMVPALAAAILIPTAVYGTWLLVGGEPSGEPPTSVASVETKAPVPASLPSSSEGPTGEPAAIATPVVASPPEATIFKTPATPPVASARSSTPATSSPVDVAAPEGSGPTATSGPAVASATADTGSSATVSPPPTSRNGAEAAPDATSTVDVRVVGAYPFELSGCGNKLSPAAKAHELQVRAPCSLRLQAPAYHLDTTRAIEASSGRVELSAPQPAHVELRTRYDWCTVMLNKRAVAGPPFVLDLAAGTYTATIQCPEKNVLSTEPFLIKPGRSMQPLDGLIRSLEK